MLPKFEREQAIDYERGLGDYRNKNLFSCVLDRYKYRTRKDIVWRCVSIDDRYLAILNKFDKNKISGIIPVT